MAFSPPGASTDTTKSRGDGVEPPSSAPGKPTVTTVQDTDRFAAGAGSRKSIVSYGPHVPLRTPGGSGPKSSCRPSPVSSSSSGSART